MHSAHKTNKSNSLCRMRRPRHTLIKTLYVLMNCSGVPSSPSYKMTIIHNFNTVGTIIMRALEDHPTLIKHLNIQWVTQ